MSNRRKSLLRGKVRYSIAGPVVPIRWASYNCKKGPARCATRTTLVGCSQGPYFAVQWDYIEQDPGWCAILGTDTGNVLKSFGDTAFGKYQCLFYYWYFAGFTPEK